MYGIYNRLGRAITNIIDILKLVLVCDDDNFILIMISNSYNWIFELCKMYYICTVDPHYSNDICLYKESANWVFSIDKNNKIVFKRQPLQKLKAPTAYNTITFTLLHLNLIRPSGLQNIRKLIERRNLCVHNVEALPNTLINNVKTLVHNKVLLIQLLSQLRQKFIISDSFSDDKEFIDFLNSCFYHIDCSLIPITCGFPFHHNLKLNVGNNTYTYDQDYLRLRIDIYKQHQQTLKNKRN